MPNKTSKAGPISAMTEKDTIVIYVGKNKTPKHISKANFLTLIGEGGISGNIYTEDGTLTGERSLDGDGNSMYMFNFDEFEVHSGGSATFKGDGNTKIGKSDSSTQISGSRILFNNYQSLVTEEIELTAAQVIGMNATPVTVIAEVTGFVIQVVDIMMVHDFGTAAFTGGGVIRFNENGYGNTVTEPVAATILTTAGDYITSTKSTNPGQRVSVGDKVVITNDTAAFATGDGVLRLYITYRVLPTGL